MSTTTKRYLSRTRRTFRPLVGLAAAAATVATLALAVVAPALAPHTDPDRLARPAARHAGPRTEVAILPGSIEVVGRRTVASRGHGAYLPATYRTQR